MSQTITHPVLILDGTGNALSLTRSFGRKGIPVYVSGMKNCFAVKSRFCKGSYEVPNFNSAKDFWSDLLLGDKHPELENCVLMVGSDIAIEFVAENKQALAEKYLVDDHVPEIHLAMLDKQKTLELGAKAGCDTPAYHNIDAIEDVEKIKDEVLYPIMLKPIHSHLFQRHYQGKKYLIAKNNEELAEKAADILENGLEFMVTEIIPGPDDLQSSYHTYMDAHGNELFQYTHRIIRRYPKNAGAGCLHASDWIPETAEAGQRFFKGIGFRGMGHIEFKHDLRDGKLKIIECNPRFSAAQSLVVKSGLDMAYLIYCHLTGYPVPADLSYRQGVRCWAPIMDARAFYELKQLGELNLSDWLKSGIGLPMAFPYFSLVDPWPFMAKFSSDFYKILSRKVNSHDSR
jgi:predicted ATP-grasp superfamily ATP-dependent carboligase